jgi:hypothetical protein
MKTRTRPTKDDAAPASSSQCRAPAPSRTPASSALCTHRRRTFCTAALLPCPGAQGEPLRPIHHAVDLAIKPWLNRAVSAHLVARCLRYAAVQTRRRLSSDHRAMTVVFQVLLPFACSLPRLTTTCLCPIAIVGFVPSPWLRCRRFARAHHHRVNAMFFLAGLTHLRGGARRPFCLTCAHTHARKWASTPVQKPQDSPLCHPCRTSLRSTLM